MSVAQPLWGKLSSQMPPWLLLSALAPALVLLCAAPVRSQDIGSGTSETVLRYDAWVEQLQTMDCSRASKPDECEEVFYDGRSLGPTPEQFAALTADVVAHLNELEPHIVHLLESDTLPLGLEYLLRFSGRFSVDLLMPLAAYAREHPSAAADMIVQLMKLDPRKNYRWVVGYTAERPRSREQLALFRRLIVIALDQPNPAPGLIDNAVRVDPSMLNDKPPGVVVPAVERRLAQDPADAEVMALMVLLGRMWPRARENRAQLLGIAGDKLWRRMALVCSAMRAGLDTIALTHWIAAVGGEQGHTAYSYGINEGLRLEGGGTVAFQVMLPRYDPSAVADAAFQQGLWRLLFDYNHAAKLAGLFRERRNTDWKQREGWVEWLRGVPVEGADRLRQRLELLMATGVDLLTLYPDLCAPSEHSYQEKLNEAMIALLDSADTARAERIIEAITAGAVSYEMSLLSSTLYDITTCKHYRRLWVTHTLPVFDRMPTAMFVELACYLPSVRKMADEDRKGEVTACAERYAKKHRKDPLVQMAVALYHYEIEGFAVEHLARAMALMARDVEPATPRWEAADILLYSSLVDRIEANGKKAAAADVDAALSKTKTKDAFAEYVVELKTRIARYEPFIFSF